MGAGSSNPGPGRKPLNAGNARRSEKVWQRQQDSSSMLFFGVIFILVIILLLGTAVLGVVYLGLPLLDQIDDWQIRSPDGVPAAGTLSPTIIVRPSVAPDMADKNKLDPTDPIVGRWKSTDISLKGYTYPTNADSFILTMYNDNTFIIHDKVNNTYTVGSWKRVSRTDYYTEYSAFEPGRNCFVRIVGNPQSLQFQYSFSSSTISPDPGWIGYISYIRAD